MMSVSPPGQERKARDLNPHGLAAALYSKPARRPVSGYLPFACSSHRRGRRFKALGNGT